MPLAGPWHINTVYKFNLASGMCCTVIPASPVIGLSLTGNGDEGAKGRHSRLNGALLHVLVQLHTDGQQQLQDTEAG